MQKLLALTKPFFEKYGLYVILVLALVLRLVKLDSAFYGTTGELYRDLNVLHDFVFLGQWPLLGPDSALGGFNFGAAYYYLLTPFYWISGYSPQGLVAASGFFSLGSVWLIYWLLKSWFKDWRAALLGSFLLAISLYDIQNAYYVSNPTLLPFFLLLFFYCLTLIIQDGARWPSVLGLSLSFFIAIQLHATALVVLPLTLIWLFAIKRLKLKLVHFAATAGLGAALLLPYLIYEFDRNFSNLRRLLVLGGSNYSLFVKPESLGAIISFWDRSMLFKNTFFNLAIIHPYVYFALLPLYFAIPLWLWLDYRRKGKIFQKVSMVYPGGLLIGIWLTTGTLMFLFFQKHIQHFYFLVLWPAPILLLTWGLWWLRSNNRKLFYYSLAVFSVIQIVQLGYFFPYVSHSEFSHKSMKSLYAFISADAEGGSCKILNLSYDVNLFAYYDKLLGGRMNFAAHDADYLYLISDMSAESSQAVAVPSRYRLVETQSMNKFKIIKYQLNLN